MGIELREDILSSCFDYLRIHCATEKSLKKEHEHAQEEYVILWVCAGLNVP